MRRLQSESVVFAERLVYLKGAEKSEGKTSTELSANLGLVLLASKRRASFDKHQRD